MSLERKVLATSKITRGFQVTITKEVRDKLDFKVGDLLVFIEEDGNVIIEKAEFLT